VRVGRRVIQQTVAHLGELDEHGRVEARVLARRLIGAPEQAPLFNDGSEHLTVPVRLKGIRVGDAVFIPANEIHASFNIGEGDAKLVVIFGPCVGEGGFVPVDVSNEPPWNGLRA